MLLQELQAKLINLIGLEANNPTLANKFIQRLGLKPAQFPEVQVQARKKSLRCSRHQSVPFSSMLLRSWMVSFNKTEEFAEELCDGTPELQRFLVHELLRANDITRCIYFVRRYHLEDDEPLRELVKSFNPATVLESAFLHCVSARMSVRRRNRDQRRRK